MAAPTVKERRDGRCSSQPGKTTATSTTALAQQLRRRGSFQCSNGPPHTFSPREHPKNGLFGVSGSRKLLILRPGTTIAFSLTRAGIPCWRAILDDTNGRNDGRCIPAIAHSVRLDDHVPLHLPA